MTSIKQVDVDELAKEKVEEIKNLVNVSDLNDTIAVNSWFSILKQIITAADLHRTNPQNDSTNGDSKSKKEIDESIYADYADDNEQFNAIDLTEQFASNSVKWTIRVKAFKLVHQLVQMLYNENQSSIDLKSPILLHLPDLIRLSFVAATSPYDDLKLQGFEMFKFLIVKFARIEEKEFRGCSILEQYRTQVLSALKPAFNIDAPPYITAIASQVCCLWICNGLEKDCSSLKRVFKLMLTTIYKLENQNVNQNSKLYTESELEQERLGILGSWSLLYSTASDKEALPSNFDTKCLSELIEPYINSLAIKWWVALKDYALLIMPSPKTLSKHENDYGNHVYTRDVALRLFAPVSGRLILASSIWLSSQLNQDLEKHFKFICGILMKEFCKSNTAEELYISCRSLSVLVTNEQIRAVFIKDIVVINEFYSVLYEVLVNTAVTEKRCQKSLKDLLNIIFYLVFSNYMNRHEVIQYSIALLVDLLVKDMKRLEEADCEKSNSEYEIYKTNISIRLCNIMVLVKISPQCLAKQSKLGTPLVNVLCSILQYKQDRSIAILLLEHLKNLYNEVEYVWTEYLISGLKDAKLSVIFTLFQSEQNLLHLSAFMKSYRHDVDLASFEQRDQLITAYITTLVKVMKLSTQKDILDNTIKHIQELSKAFPEEYKKLCTSDQTEFIEKTVLRIGEDKKNSKINFPAPKKPQQARAKIVLKADFSHFYSGSNKK